MPFRARSATASPRVIFAALAVLMVVIACSGVITGPDGPDTRPRLMRVAPDSLRVALGDTARVTASLFDITGTATTAEPGTVLRYASADTTIARVDTVSGLVTGVGGGSTEVRGIYGALTLGVPVTVTTRPRIVVVSGGAQTAEQGDTLGQPIVVRALDAAGQPVANSGVDFVVLTGGGAVTAPTVTTDANGLAQVRWVLGLALGAQSIRAQRAGSDSAVISATATAGTTVRRVAVTATRTTLVGTGDTTSVIGRAYNVVDSLLPGSVLTWSTSDTLVAVVSGTGLVTSRGTGLVYVRAASGAYRDSLLITVQPPANTGVKHWSGAVDDAWLTAGNWIEGAAPLATDSVVIPATGVTNLPRIAARDTVRSLVNLNAGALVIDGNSLYIVDALVLRSDVRSADCIDGDFRLLAPSGAGARALGGWMRCGLASAAGDRVLVDSLVIETEALQLSGTAKLTLAGRTIRTPDLQIVLNGNARLEMLDAADRVYAPSLTVPANGEGSMFSAGELHLRDLLEVTPGSSTFIATGTHRVIVEGPLVSPAGLITMAPNAQLRHVEFRVPMQVAGTLALSGDFSMTAGGAVSGGLASPHGLPERLIVGGDYTADAGATNTLRAVELAGALVAPDFAPDTLVLTGTGQRLPLDGAVTGIKNVRIAAGATVTARLQPNTMRYVFGDLLIEGDFGIAESFVAAMGVDNSLRVTGNGILRLGGNYSTLRVEGNALFDGRAMTNELASGAIELGGDLIQRATASPNSLRTGANFTFTLMGSGAIDFATPDSSWLTTLEHWGNLTRTLRTNLSVHGQVRYDLNNVTVRSDVLGAGGTRTITSLGVDFGGNSTHRNVAWRVLDGAALDLSGDPTFSDFDPTAVQFELIRSSGSVNFSFPVFNTVPTGAGRYLKVSDPDGATGGAFTVDIGTPFPATHGGFAEAVAPAVINNWPSGTVLSPLQLGTDGFFPAALQEQRVVRFPSALAAPTAVSIVSLDTAAVLVAPDGVTLGRDSIVIGALTGDTARTYWLQAKENATGTARIVARAAGFAPDTVVVTIVNPAVRVRFVTPTMVPTGGGAAPVILLEVGLDDEGTLTPMALRRGGGGASFIVSLSDTVPARLRFTSTAATIGADQSGTGAVTFTLRELQSATTLPDTGLNIPASLTVDRTGREGNALLDVLPPANWGKLAPSIPLQVVAPLLHLTPDSIAFTSSTSGPPSAAQTVTITNASIGALGAISRTIEYGPGASDWLTATIDSLVDPVTMQVAVVAQAYPAGTYTALVIVEGATAGTIPDTLRVTLVVTSPVAGPPVRIEKVSGDSSAATVGTPLPASFVARVVDTNGLPVPGVVVGWSAIHGCCNPVASETDTTDANGLVSLSFTMPTVASVITAQATATGLTGSPLAFTAFAKPAAATALAFSLNTGGGLAGSPITPGWTVRAVDQFANTDTTFTGQVTVALSNGPAFATLGGTSVRNAVAGVVLFDDLTVNVANSSWVLLATSPGLATAGSAAFSISIPVTMTIIGGPVIGVGSTATVRASIPVPSYGTGLVIGLNVLNTSIVTVNAPANVTLPVGDTVAIFTITGASNGSTFMNATVDGAGAGQIVVNVTNQIISLPSTVSVPYGLTTSMPVQLAVPAPVGGVTVSLTSSDPSRVGVMTPSLFFAAGQTLSSATLSGVLPGSATITATAPGWVTDTSSASTTAQLVASPNAIGINATFGSTFEAQLRSNGSSISAPAPGVTVTLTPLNAACVSAPATVTIPTGQSSVIVPISYGGSAATPCNTYVRLTATNLQPDSIQVAVAPPPGISIGDIAVGAGLQTGHGLFLQAPNYGSSIVVHVASSDPSRVLVAPNSTAPGVASFDATLTNGNTGVSFYTAAVAGATGSATIAVTAPGYTSASSTITIRPMGVDVIGVPSVTQTLSANSPMQARVGMLNAAGTTIESEQVIRVGGAPVTVTIDNANAAVAQLTNGTVTGQSVTTVIQPNNARSPYGAANGGPELDPLAAGTSSISASAPGAIPTSQATQSFTVNAPTIFTGDLSVGAGLQTNSGFSLSASNYGASLTVHLVSTDSSRVRLMATPTSAAVGSLDIVLTNNAGGAGFTLVGLEGTSGTSELVVTAPGFAPETSTVTVRGIGFDVISLPTSTTSLTTNFQFQARIGLLNAAGTGIESEQPIRFNGTPIVATITNSNAAVARLIAAPDTGQSITVTIPVGTTRSGTGAGSAEFDPLGAGTTTVSGSAPGTTAISTATQVITITAPGISIGDVAVGAGLQTGHGASLLASSYGPSITVHVESSDPSRLLVMPTPSSPAVASFDVVLTNGQTGISFSIAGVEAASGNATVTVSAPGFTSAVSNVAVRGVGIDLLSVPANTTSLTTNSGFQVRIGRLNAAGTGIEAEDPIRVGGTPITATITNSNATVGQLVTSSTIGQSAQVTIPVGAARNVFDLPSGGVEFDPLSTGTTQVSVSAPGTTPTSQAVQAVVVSAPTISSGAVTVGGGLIVGSGFSLGASGYGTTTVHIESSNPALALVSPDGSTAGAAFIDVPMTAPATGAQFYVSGLEGVTGSTTITISAPGFTSVIIAVTVRAVGVDIISLGSTYTAGGPDVEFQVRLGMLNASGTGIESEQPVRPGGAARTVTLASATPAVGQLRAPTLGAGATVSIPIGQARSPFGSATGGVAFVPLAAGSTAVSATSPGLVSLANATVAITVNP